MLLPLESAIIDIDEARQIVAFIESSTATKSNPKNYEKIIKLGMIDLYEKLIKFIGIYDHYHRELKYIDTETRY